MGACLLISTTQSLAVQRDGTSRLAKKILIIALRKWAKGMGAHLSISIINRDLVPKICIYTVNRNHVDVYSLGSGDLHMCGSQMDRNIARILVFLDDLWCFIMHLVWIWCDMFVAGGGCASIRDCASIRTYAVIMQVILTNTYVIAWPSGNLNHTKRYLLLQARYIVNWGNIKGTHGNQTGSKDIKIFFKNIYSHS